MVYVVERVYKDGLTGKTVMHDYDKVMTEAWNLVNSDDYNRVFVWSSDDDEMFPFFDWDRHNPHCFSGPFPS